MGAGQEKLEVVEQFFQGFNYQRYFPADTAEKLSIILQTEEYVLNQEDGKARYIREVTLLSKSFALVIRVNMSLMLLITRILLM